MIRSSQIIGLEYYAQRRRVHAWHFDINIGAAEQRPEIRFWYFATTAGPQVQVFTGFSL